MKKKRRSAVALRTANANFRISGNTPAHKPAALRKSNTPSLAQMVLDSKSDQEIIGEASKRSLLAWFRQSERLKIARTDHRLRSSRFTDFASRIGIENKTDAYDLVKLWKWKAAILERCDRERKAAELRGQRYRYPGWDHALGWFERSRWRYAKSKAAQNVNERGTPPNIFKKFGDGCTLDVAASDELHVCARYFTKRQNGLNQQWVGKVWMNPPFSDPYPWSAKAVEHARAGGTVIALLPVWTDAKWFIEFVPLGRVTLLSSRVRYLGAVGSAPFPSMIVVWSPETVCSALRDGSLRIRLEA